MNRLVFSLCFLFLAAAQAWAHPHVWVLARTNLAFDAQGNVTGLGVEWSFDEAYAKFATDGLDKNGDGIFQPEELTQLTNENISSLKDYEYFTSVRVAGKKVPTGAVTHATQTFEHGKLTLRFFLPLATPADPRSGAVSMKQFDPEFYIAIDYAEKGAFRITGSPPEGCKAVLIPPPSEEQMKEKRAFLATKGPDWQPSADEEFGESFSATISVTCAR